LIICAHITTNGWQDRMLGRLYPWRRRRMRRHPELSVCTRVGGIATDSFGKMIAAWHSRQRVSGRIR
jgi:hypothetical protein